MSETDEIRRLGIDQRVYAVSHPGGRERNEDSYLAKKWNSGWIFAVADGLGGHRAGEIASRCAIQSLLTSFSHQEGFPTKGLLRRAFEEAHENIRSRAKGNWEGMGTTLVTACVTDMTAIFANTGDSRAYVIRDKVIYRTRDHSVVQDLVAGGALTEEQARLHPM
jgi:serine/threonine protein phosphatase PrpC